MNIATALRYSSFATCHSSLAPRHSIAFAGAGGKTTSMFALARQLPPPVLVTTTTHLAVHQAALADFHRVMEDSEDVAELVGNLPTGVILVTGRESGDGRLVGVGEAVLEGLRSLAKANRYSLLIEADGSRLRPLKAPAEHEPVIPSFVDTVVVVAGLSGLGKPLNEEWVHRPGRFADLSGLSLEAVITPEALVRVLVHPEGGLKNIPPAAHRIALLNQADTPELQATAQGMADELLGKFHSVIISTFNVERSTLIVVAVHEPVAGILLAAGGSERFGQPKQLLDWHGEPFVRHVARTALAAGLSPVVVVTGAYAVEVENAVSELPAQVENNPDWQGGQSTSIRAGLHALPDERRVGAAIFLLADQPQIPVALLQSLVETHARTLAPVVAPRVNGQRGNPVLFDRNTFPDLLALTGDVGGRALFSRYPVEWLPWNDASVLIDVDTEEDYRKLLRP
jgi:molybdenum cofactor cytidylyltransferase